MNFEIRRLLPEELEMALALAWETFLQFEAPDYGPEGTESFRKDIVENPAFCESCSQGRNRLWGAFDGKSWLAFSVCEAPPISAWYLPTGIITGRALQLQFSAS